MYIEHVIGNKQHNNINEMRIDTRSVTRYNLISVTCLTNLSGCNLSVSRSLTAVLVGPAVGEFLWTLIKETGQGRTIYAILYYEYTEPLEHSKLIHFLHSLQICRLFPLQFDNISTMYW
jgi:hypothetical protein